LWFTTSVDNPKSGHCRDGHWSPTTLREKLVKIEAKAVRHEVSVALVKAYLYETPIASMD